MLEDNSDNSIKTRQKFRITKKRTNKIGLPPGTPVFVGKQKTENVTITVIDYNSSSYTESKITDIKEYSKNKENHSISWINVVGLHDTELLEEFGEKFNLHPLLLEDILNTDQRPKIDDFDEHLFCILKMLGFNDNRNSIIIEQVSFILSENYVISFQEKPDDIFDTVRDRLKNNKGKIRVKTADYLFYSLLDVIVDNYFSVIEKLGDVIEFLEEEVVTNPHIETLQTIHNLKTNIIFLRKSIWPLREILSRLERIGSELILEDTQRYLRDVYDHVIQVIDTVETLRDIVSGMLDIYLSSISNRMNEIMKILTIVSTVVIPMTVISGIYGMNFQKMPELAWSLGYPMALFFMLVIAIIMITFFWRKNWL